MGIPILNHQNIKIKAIENVEKAELKTSLSRIEDITSLEHIEDTLLPNIERNHLNCKTRIGFLCDDELIL